MNTLAVVALSLGKYAKKKKPGNGETRGGGGGGSCTHGDTGRT